MAIFSQIKKSAIASIMMLVILLLSFEPVSGATDIEGVGTKVESHNINADHVVRGSQIKWVYKQENGKIYKRLYDTKNSVFIGEWILVGPV